MRAIRRSGPMVSRYYTDQPARVKPRPEADRPDPDPPSPLDFPGARPELYPHDGVFVAIAESRIQARAS